MYKFKNAKKLKVEDMKGLAHFNRIIKNYLKMLKIENKGQTSHSKHA